MSEVEQAQPQESPAAPEEGSNGAAVEAAQGEPQVQGENGGEAPQQAVATPAQVVKKGRGRPRTGEHENNDLFF